MGVAVADETGVGAAATHPRRKRAGRACVAPQGPPRPRHGRLAATHRGHVSAKAAPRHGDIGGSDNGGARHTPGRRQPATHRPVRVHRRDRPLRPADRGVTTRPRPSRPRAPVASPPPRTVTHPPARTRAPSPPPPLPPPATRRAPPTAISAAARRSTSRGSRGAAWTADRNLNLGAMECA